MLFVIGALVLSAAGLGYFSWLHRRLAIDFAFIPGIAFSLITATVFLSGILNVLPLTVVTIVFCGSLLLVFEWRSHHERLKATLREPALWMMAGATVYVGWVVRGQRFTHYDNFSHWALVVRVMLTENRFPTFEDPVVVFQSYPLGSASFIYLVSKVLGSSESVMMLSQGVLILGFVVGLMGISRRHRIAAGVLTVGTFAVVLSYNIPLDSLLVDSLLAAITGYLLLFVVVHRARLMELLLPFTAILCTLATVKNGGILFAVIGAVLAAVIGNGTGRRLGWRFWAASGNPFLILLLWNRHVDLVFSDGLDAKHSLSVAYLASVFNDKTPAQVTAIVQRYVGLIVSDRVAALLLVGSIILAIVLVRKKVFAPLTAALMSAGLILMTIVYHGGILAMYLFSMPVGEALALAGHERYLRVMHLVLLMMLIGLLLTVLERTHKVAQRFSYAAGAAGGAALLIAFVNWSALLPNDRMSSVRTGVLRAVGSAKIPSSDRVCILLNQYDHDYRLYLVRYSLLSANVVNKVIGPKTNPKNLRDCQHFVLLENNPLAVALLSAQGLHIGRNAPVLVHR